MNIRPLHDRVIVKRTEEEEKTKGGIIIPDSAKEKPVEGVIIAVGAGKELRLRSADFARDRQARVRDPGARVEDAGREVVRGVRGVALVDGDSRGTGKIPCCATSTFYGTRHRTCDAESLSRMRANVGSTEASPSDATASTLACPRGR